MKLNIKKFQQGGSTGSLFSQYTPFYSPTQPVVKQESPSKKDKEDVDPYLKDLRTALSGMSGKGLTSDINTLYNQTASMLEEIELSGRKLDSRTYMGILSKINEVSNNKLYYDEAKKKAISNGTLGDVAVSSSGGMYVIDNNGNQKMVSAEEYADNRDRYRALTNNDLFIMRNSNNGYAYNNSIVQSVAESKSINDVQTEIKAILDLVESNELKYESYGNKTIGSKNIHDISEGLRAILDTNISNINSPEFKAEITQKGVPYENVKMALNYMYNNLSRAAINKLTVHAATTRKGNPRDNVINDMVDLLKFGKPASESIKFDEIEDKETGSSSGSGSSEKTSDLSIYGYMNMAEDNTKIELDFSGKTGDSSYVISGSGVSLPLSNPDGKKVDSNIMMDDVFNQGLATYVDVDSATDATGNSIPKDSFKDIMFTGSNVVKMMLPYTTRDGKKVVDINAQKRYNDIIKSDEYNKMDSIQRSRVIEKFELHPFLIVNTYIPEHVAELTGLDNIIDKVDSKKEDRVIELYDIYNAGLSKEKSKASYSPGGIFDDDIYESSLFIALQDDQIAHGFTSKTPAQIEKTQYGIENQMKNQSIGRKGKLNNVL